MIKDILNLQTKYSMLREIDMGDLETIIKIRGSKNNSVLHPISSSLQDQEIYYKGYLQRAKVGDEVYYKIYDRSNPTQVLGFVRITELQGSGKFSWESFILDDLAPPFMAYDVMLAIYGVGFEVLKKDLCGPWGVPKGAKNIMKFHEYCGMAEVVSEDEKFTMMTVSRQNYLARIDFFKKRNLGILELNNV